MTIADKRGAETRATDIVAAVIRRAATTTTHQAMAFDAVGRLRCANSAAWHRLFLAHAQTLALGAEAPDADFRDFKNHLVFPADEFWGGAPDKARCWYRNLVSALNRREWQNASYCAGVLSHYIADALHPFHTAQSPADNDVSSALDLSVAASYRKLAATGRATCRPVMLGTGREFLVDAIKAGAVHANAHYASLISHVDLARTTADPAAGLDAAGRAVMADVIGRATALIVAVIERAIEDAAQPPPVVSLTASGAVAIIGLPVTVLSNWMHRRAARRLLRVMAGELAANGRVTTLSPQVRIKRDVAPKTVDRPNARHSGNVVAFEPRHPVPARESDGDSSVVIAMRHRRRMIADRVAVPVVEGERVNS